MLNHTQLYVNPSNLLDFRYSLYLLIPTIIPANTKMAPHEVILVYEMEAEIREKMDDLLKDSILTLLLSRSQLTRIQAETLFIEALTNDLAERTLNSDVKAKIRSKNKALTRGAFNRTLSQAKSNIRRSIFTILLLNYVGLLPSLGLTYFEEATNKLKEYLETYKGLSNADVSSSEYYKKLRILRSELEDLFSQLMKM
ncbi:hypothetical protein A3K70_01520 [Candidatus Bathyarchaeota archaeon RBG_16_48_13]|nr:MAG: hypothetical protein A3K70_01520 [Candidatus Bathyarchaeota archaeon RBG_16_48_13]